jgi:hypothetical protein
VNQVCKALPERRVHKELPVLRVFKVQLAVLDPKAFKVLLVLQALQVSKEHKDQQAHKDHKAHKVALDLKVFKEL